MDLAARYGYEPILIPLFEATELYSRGVGEDTEVVEKQMYTFKDKAGRSITLRPEATAGIVRALIQAGGVTGPTKVSLWGPMFRYERPQKGRNRQFHQADIEYFGETSADADVEVIEFGYRYLVDLDIPDPVVALNSIGDTEDRTEFRELLAKWLMEREERLSVDARARIATNPLRVLDSKADADVVAEAPAPLDHLGPGAADHFSAVKRGLDRRGIPYTIDSRLVRGLDYYNRTVWEYFSPAFEAAQAALGGGGRYDPLFETLGGKPTPGVGVAMGLDRVIEALSDSDEARLDVFVVVAADVRRDDALALVAHLREAGVATDIDLGTRSVKSQFRTADRRRARVAIVVGEEWAGGEVTAKDLTSGVQDVIATDEIAAWVEGR